MSTSYDLVRYPNWPNTRAHPATFGALARLMGRAAAPLHKCRVLEIACSEGVNIASMATVAPRSEFVGIDIAETAVARGRETIVRAGLDNIRLAVADIRDPTAIEGVFDYIIAHGVYAWVEEDVRAALMRAAATHLSADGVAFISYNCYPGCRVRQTLRDYLGFILADISDPQERMETARAALRYQMTGWSEDAPFQRALIEAARAALERPAEVLFHDEMGEIWRPQFLKDVVAAARAEGLAYLADAHSEILDDAFFPSARFEAARAQTGGDWARYEQLCDFTDMRPFRWSLFVRADGPIDRIATPDRLKGLWASADFQRVERRPETRAHVFKAGSGVEFQTDDENLAGVFDDLSASLARPLDDMTERADVMEALLRLYAAGVISLSTAPPAFTLTPGARPLASPLARAQAARGEKVLAGLHHKPVQLIDPFWNMFLPKLDGGRTHDDLSAIIAASVGKPLTEAREIVPQALRELAGYRLLMR